MNKTNLSSTNLTTKVNIRIWQGKTCKMIKIYACILCMYTDALVDNYK
jgi:hypothetical protein